MKGLSGTRAAPELDAKHMANFDIEQTLIKEGYRCVAGADEVGRGPLAGPVVTAAVILDPANIPPGLNDSKRLTETQRETLFPLILASAALAVVSMPPIEIDRLNIRMGSLMGMARAVAALPIIPDHVLVDGRDRLPGLAMPCTALIDGDARSVSIAAASIVAKVIRDRMMRKIALEHPDYGWATNMGYPTGWHRAAIARLGGVIHHRRGFAPFKNGTVDLFDG